MATYSYITDEEKQLLDGCVETGSFIFFEVLKSIIATQIQNMGSSHDSEQKSSLAGRITGNVIGFSAGLVTSPFVGASISEAVYKGTNNSIQSLVAHFERETKRQDKQNILSWTNTLLSKAADSSLTKNITQGMALICISFKDQLASLPENDFNRINFFSDVVRRILKYLSEYPGHEKALDPHMVYNAFIQGKSTPKKISGTRIGKTRGLRVGSSESEQNTREIFEDCGLLESTSGGDYRLYLHKARDRDNISKVDVRLKFPFEDRLWENHIETDIRLEELKNDWRLYEENVHHFIENVSISKSTGLKDILSSLESTNSDIIFIRKAVERIELNQLENSTSQDYRICSTSTGKKDSKSPHLKNKWWPDKKMLIKSLQKRKVGDRLLVEDIHEKLASDENRRAVIFETVRASKYSGLGGIGKTTTAKWYAHHYESEYTHIIWIDCGEGSLLSSFRNLARDLKVEFWSQIPELKELARKSFEILSSCKCLLVYDNAESYQDNEGIKDALPKYENNFFCLITSRHREWGNKTGLGSASEIEIDVFECDESVEFLKANLSKDVSYTDYQLIQLGELLGNLPLAVQLAVTTLNNQKMSLSSYIQRTSVEDSSNIVNSKFDDYERTVNMNIKIILESIKKEQRDNGAYNILMIFGYIRPDNVESEFLRKVVNLGRLEFKAAIDLLEKYSLVTKTGKLTVNSTRGIFSNNSSQSETDLLSIHRLLQQVIRYIGKNDEKATLQKILKCKGYLDYKLIPYCQFASEDIKREFKKIRAKLVEQVELSKLLHENRLSEAVELASIIESTLKSHASAFNYAACLLKRDHLAAVEVLENLYARISAKPKKSTELSLLQEYLYAGSGILNLKYEPNSSLVAGLLFLAYCKQQHFDKAQLILDSEEHLIIKFTLDALHNVTQSLDFIPMIKISSNVIHMDRKVKGVDIIPSPNSYHISPKDFIIGNTRYRTGCLAVVHEGSFKETPVAVKSPHNHGGFTHIITELKTLMYLGKHPNILNLIGVCTAEIKHGTTYTFFERCPLGSLQNILIDSRECDPLLYGMVCNSTQFEINISQYHLCSWSYQMAIALQFLAEKKVVHRLLMAHNVLLFDNHVIKITDFELSKQLEDDAPSESTENTFLPWRYSAIESLKSFEFTVQSDIWSFGVVLWELFSLGKTPFADIQHSDYILAILDQNERLSHPKHASKTIYNFMLKCWKDIPEERPNAKNCVEFFTEQKEHWLKVISRANASKI